MGREVAAQPGCSQRGAWVEGELIDDQVNLAAFRIAERGGPGQQQPHEVGEVALLDARAGQRGPAGRDRLLQLTGILQGIAQASVGIGRVWHQPRQLAVDAGGRRMVTACRRGLRLGGERQQVLRESKRIVQSLLRGRHRGRRGREGGWAAK